MTVKSMTGFARTSGHYVSQSNGETAWTVELRSVNGKGLDIRLRMPNSLDSLDAPIRKHLNQNLKRGNVTLNIALKNQETKGRIELNEDAFKDVLAAARIASDISEMAMPPLGTLLNMRHVLQEQDTLPDDEETKAMQEALLISIKEAADTLVKARSDEGSKLKDVLEDRLLEIRTLVEKATNLAPHQPQMIKTRITESLDALLNDREELDPQRLHQEATLLAVKADVSEELDRLHAHIEQANAFLEMKGPIGRQFDFLCQEFNREANTLCSKSQSKELTYIGLELKTVIDQLREQVQNIE